MLDPDSTTFSTAKAPTLPLRSWTSQGVPDTLLAHWAEQQQQQQLGSTLSHVSMTGAGAGGDASVVGRMAGLKGLKELTLDGAWPDPPKVPSSISLLTKLQLLGPPADAGALQAVCAHTTLQHLSLPGAAVEELPDTLASLKQLTCLVLTGSSISKLPGQLGVWLPRLQRLEVGKCKLAAVPTTLTSLTHLDMSSSTAARLTLPTTLTTLKELVISQGAFKRMPKCISGLTALEHLDVSFCKALTSLSILQPLARLRHLNLIGVNQCEAASYTVLGALQQLTYLGLQSCPAPACAALAGSEPLVALQQLHVCCLGPSSVSALGPWLSRLTALTWLSMAGSRIGVKEQLLFLPAQLQEVALYDMYLSRLPSGISQLRGLQVLHCGRNSGLRLLPAWLSQLHHLETLDLHGTEVSTEQQVLAHMPALRCVRVSPWNAARVYGGAAHLHFGHSSRLMRETWS
jgi:Leucine-rich repeat (LRR) protein